MSQDTVYVDCPCCAARLEVRRRDGKVVEHWKKPAKSVGGGDLLKAASDKLKTDKEKRDSYFANAKDILKEQMRQAQEKFEQEKKRIAREGDTSRPPNPFDLD